jgi:hypothetical protein
VAAAVATCTGVGGGAAAAGSVAAGALHLDMLLLHEPVPAAQQNLFRQHMLAIIQQEDVYVVFATVLYMIFERSKCASAAGG